MEDEDAVMVANKWWSSIHPAMRPSIISLLSAINDAGLPRPTKNCTLREMLIHTGNRLVDEKIVKLTRSAGITKDDIIIL